VSKLAVCAPLEGKLPLECLAILCEDLHLLHASPCQTVIKNLSQLHNKLSFQTSRAAFRLAMTSHKTVSLTSKLAVDTNLITCSLPLCHSVLLAAGTAM